MKRRITLFFFLSCLFSIPLCMYAQDVVVTGKVVSQADGMPLPGVTVMVQGTTTGVVTDGNGNYRVSATPASKLVFSQLGMKEQIVAVNDKTEINIRLSEDVNSLSEVVVVGYGVQKKSVVTGAISKVTAGDFESQPVTRLEQVLQGRTSGLTIASSSGQPGDGATVRVRGITSIGNNDPLWVVDGVVVDNGGIAYLNQSDIESVEVLKDAASQAIYGTRAAAGVILVTTKKGKAGDVRINYAGWYGIAAPARKLDLLNATQYATLRNEASVASGNGLVFTNPESYGQGTNWQSYIFNESAKRTNNELSISGGSEKATFYTSFGYQDQDGIVATDISHYTRANMRLNSTYTPAKWLTLGENIGYAYNKSIGLGNTNSEYGGPLSSSINLDPITPAVETDPAKASASPYNNINGVRRNDLGYPYGISPYVGQELTNPLAYESIRLGNNGWGHNIVGNIFAEVSPIKGLKLRSTVGSKLAFYGSESFTPKFYLNSSTINSENSFNRGINRRFDWNIENTAAYTRTFSKHNATILIGQGAYAENRVFSSSITYKNIPVDNFDDASMNYTIPADQITAGGGEGQLHTISSLFARLNYNYDEKYLLEGIIRRDGSSRFGGNNKYGYFPSFSLGWVPTRESFWPQNEVVNFLKIRGGYGVVGSDSFGDNAFLSTIGGGRSYSFGNQDGYVSGYSPNAPSNPDLRWEETSQTNIGLDVTLFKDVTFTTEYYKKKTTGILQTTRIPAYVGAIANPYGNVGDMENSGVEFELGYRKQLGEVNFSVNGNFSTLKNQVTYLGDGIEYLSGGTGFASSAYPITRTAVGEAYNSFFGFQTKGIFQNQAEIDNYTGVKGKIQPNAKPGDFIWADTNDDGSITEKDRVFIGNPTPSYQFGFTASAGYKNFDILLFGQGSGGNKIFQGLRRLDVSNANWTTKALSRWIGEGSSNTYPRLVQGDPSGNFNNPSDFYLEDGDYFRIKTLQIGYTFSNSLISKAGMKKARVYLTGENLVTFTQYTGFDPEIGGGSFSIDRGIYPQARTFLVGLSVGF